MHPGNLEIMGRVQRTGPARDGIQGPQRREQVPLQHDKLADQPLLLPVAQTVLPTAPQKPMPPPGPGEKPLHRLLLGRGERGGLDDVLTESEKDLSLLRVRQTDDDPLVRGAVRRLHLHAQPAKRRQTV